MAFLAPLAAPALVPPACGAGMLTVHCSPSRQICFSLIRLFLTRSAAGLLLLVRVLMALDLLGESGKILKVHGNGQAELLHYVALRVPLLIQKFLPFAVLLGTLSTFTGLLPHREVGAVKTSALSEHPILAPNTIPSLGTPGAQSPITPRVPAPRGHTTP